MSSRSHPRLRGFFTPPPNATTTPTTEAQHSVNAGGYGGFPDDNQTRPNPARSGNGDLTKTPNSCGAVVVVVTRPAPERRTGHPGGVSVRLCPALQIAAQHLPNEGGTR
jgi:hypothetical protein